MDTSIIRNMKDFQMLYNRMSETCFNTCISSFLLKDASTIEVECIEKCSSKYINAHNKMMELFMEVQPTILRRNMKEYEKSEQALATTQQEQNPDSST